MVEFAERRPWVVLVGGFLGAGKTSLILAAVRVLESRGKRCAVILNDQGDELVDELHAEVRGALAGSVTGGCLCCKFSGLVSVIDDLSRNFPDVIFAEPVGSCTDISATVLGPLREEFDRYRIAPLTVLVDPTRARELLDEGADADLAFLFRNQLREADLVCFSKADAYEGSIPSLVEFEDASAHKARRLSAKTEQGVKEWLDEILFGSLEVGRTTLDLDYGRYAQAEAALVWLNLSFVRVPAVACSPAMAMGPLMDNLSTQLTRAGIPILHLKMLTTSGTGWLKAAICAHGEDPEVEGDLGASPSGRHEILVNLRAKGDASEVRKIVEEQLQCLDGRVERVRLACFSPAAPNPERRMQHPNS